MGNAQDIAHKSSREIERDIEADRARLAETLDALSHKLSFDGLFSQVGDSVKRNGSDMGHALATTVRDNPLAVALTAAGLAWLFGGQTVREKAAELRSSDTPSDSRYPSWIKAEGVSRVSHQTPTSREPHAAPFMADTPSSYGSSGFADSASIGRSTHPTHGQPYTQPSDGLGSRVAGAAASVRDTASGAFEATKDAVSSAAHAVADTVGSVAGSVSHGARSQAEWLRESLSFDTEGLSEAARERVIAARQKAVEFRAYAARQANSGVTHGRDFVQQHPIVVGAGVLALGAAIAASLPRTRIEDDRFGKYSDDLVAEAERVAREEMEKAKAAARDLSREARSLADETIDDARSAAKRTLSDAESEAKSLGVKAEGAARKAGDAVSQKASEAIDDGAERLKDATAQAKRTADATAGK